ncbi:hypothetical protein [Conexibacter sp. SYSU D00693]|uniref:hypothetical protein n=1 Tax=Conexibacter sp. SYSU D00693 TaxID=2812560 RepID=UPI00196B3E73|nr:hypothetical protein [Conexibacter sp. SYSU D00693]
MLLLHPVLDQPAGIDREQALVAETAIAAAGGGALRLLHREGRLRDRWYAVVDAPAGGQVTVELDARMGTAVIRPVTLRQAA